MRAVANQSYQIILMYLIHLSNYILNASIYKVVQIDKGGC